MLKEQWEASVEDLNCQFTRSSWEFWNWKTL